LLGKFYPTFQKIEKFFRLGLKMTNNKDDSIASLPIELWKTIIDMAFESALPPPKKFLEFERSKSGSFKACKSAIPFANLLAQMVRVNSAFKGILEDSPLVHGLNIRMKVAARYSVARGVFYKRNKYGLVLHAQTRFSADENEHAEQNIIEQNADILVNLLTLPWETHFDIILMIDGDLYSYIEAMEFSFMFYRREIHCDSLIQRTVADEEFYCDTPRYDPVQKAGYFRDWLIDLIPDPVENTEPVFRCSDCYGIQITFNGKRGKYGRCGICAAKHIVT
jgi:hypothetical protein